MIEKNCSSIILGTAQWGLHYGISNSEGITSSEQVSKILKRAASAKINLIDTAPGYGDAELKIGRNSQSLYNIITKIPKMPKLTSVNDRVKFIENSVQKSMVNLGSESIYGLLFHDADDLIEDKSGTFVAELFRLKETGVVKNIGVSVYNSTQIDTIVSLFTPDIVQAPVNILDQRLIHSGHLKKLQSLGTKIHARSVFLQGLLHIPINSLPKYFEPIKAILANISDEVIEQGLTMNQAALSFIRDQPHVDNTIIGIESEAQLVAAINDFMVDKSFHTVSSGLIDERFVNPINWDIHNGR